MAKRPCLECGTPTPRTRCPSCERSHDHARGTTASRGYGTQWRKDSERQRKAWVEANGWTCHGWEVPSHPATDLVTDHDVGVLCRSCNARKAATVDKQRAHGGRGV